MGLKRWDTPRALHLLERVQGKRLEQLRNQIRWRLYRHPDEELRAGFANHYRTRGVRSQAARWGIVTPGWSTPEEVRELRHWLLGRFRGDDEVRQLLFLPSDHPLPPEVADLADPAFRSRGRERVTGSGWCALLAAMLLLALVMIVSALYAAGWWVPRLWQPISDPGDWGQGLASLVVLGTSALGLAVAYLWFKIVTRAEETGADSFQPVTSRLFPTELAWSLVDQGDDRAATILLKALLTTGGEPQQTRRALVQMSRDRRRIDMAGRWGIVVGGLTTPDEQRAFAAAVQEKGATETALRELSLVRFDESLTPEAHQVLKWASKSVGKMWARPLSP